MGQMVYKMREPLLQSCDTVSELIKGRGRKRKRELNCQNSKESREGQCDCESPKRKRLLTTTKYIYQALFKEEKNSDIRVVALNKVWCLHKVYLGQSPYFHSMFNGSWREAEQDVVQIQILDDNITVDSLDAVFGSMYSDEIEVDTKNAISILATATLFHLDGIIDKCTEVMNENINEETVVKYFNAAGAYGCMNVRKTAFQWLEINLLCLHTRNFSLLRSINIDLMTDLIKSKNLYVMQTEFSLYTLLRTWMFLCIFRNFDPEDAQFLQKANKKQHESNEEKEQDDDVPKTSVIQHYFRSRENQCCFLATPEGKPYLQAFRALRTQYLTNHSMDLNFVIVDNIIPREWMNSHIVNHWNYILRVDHMGESGPKNVDEHVFYENCMRCGRVLLEPGYQKWRWTGFNFGLDLIVVADGPVILVRRHHRHENERMLSLQSKRTFLIKASVTSINMHRQPIFTQTTDIQYKCLDKNEETTLMTLDAKLKFPLLISVSLLTTPPLDLSIKDMPLQKYGTECNVPISEISGDLEACAGFSDESGNSNDDSAIFMLSNTQRNSRASSFTTATSSTTT